MSSPFSGYDGNELREESIVYGIRMDEPISFSHENPQEPPKFIGFLTEQEVYKRLATNTGISITPPEYNHDTREIAIKSNNQNTPLNAPPAAILRPESATLHPPFDPEIIKTVLNLYPLESSQVQSCSSFEMAHNFLESMSKSQRDSIQFSAKAIGMIEKRFKESGKEPTDAYLAFLEKYKPRSHDEFQRR